jgi:hypothetical protein
MFSIRKSFISVAVGLLIALDGLVPTAAIASIALVQAEGSSNGTNPSVTFTSACAIGQPIIAILGQVGDSPTITVSDNLNTGNYTLLGTFFDSTNHVTQAVFMIKCNAAGVPTVSTSIGNGDTGKLIAGIFNGFLGTPTLDASIVTDFGPITGSVNTFSPITSNFTNELMLLASSNGDFISTISGGWTDLTGSSGAAFFKLVTSAGSSANFTANMGASTWIDGVLVGIHDVVSGAALAGSASDSTSATAALSTTAAPFAPIFLDNATHVNGSDQIGMGNGIQGSNTGDLAPVAFQKIKQWAIDANTNFSKIFRVRSVMTPLTGFSISVVGGITDQVLNPAGTLATGAIVFPPNPGDQQPFILKSSQTVTAFSATTSDGTSANGVPGTLPANVALKWIFVAPLNTWFREQ